MKTAADARLHPELAVLFVHVHGKEAQGPRAGFEELMQPKYEFQSDFAEPERYVSVGREEGRQAEAQAMLRCLVQCLGVELDAAMSKRLDAAPLELLKDLVEDVVADLDPGGVIAEQIAQRLYE